MRVAVTGGTGYLGAHTVKALLDAGHSVRLLVAPGCGTEPVIGRLRELGSLEVLDGDIRDSAVVAALLDGCDSVLHAAGVVGTNDRQEKLMWDINAYATEAILTRAVDAGLDPVVSVSSYSALFPPPNGIIGPDSPTVPGRSAYARTKAYGDRVARRLQEAGAPVVVTYPSSVVGPAFHTAPGVTERGWATIARYRVAPVVRGGMAMVDVRDIGRVHEALMRPGRGPHRYICGGILVGFDEMIDAVEQGLGKRVRRIRVAPSVFRGIGRVSDLVSKFVALPESLSYEAAWLLTTPTPTDDSTTLGELGLQWSSPTAAIIESLRVG
ncbi:NAD-dependent epimerase/dehydratase family protein [Mycolicibacter longobardus]|uniref:Dehydrogenase n=1 Tax=Mycolicibacter longobardus TaxID=1108812 RepID=A0A1X1YJ99_9MYCO|nr:NAD-dependent epimerase/dehydratase family protein [Mycolicibacter longobardus]MCV7385556.1 NAD-dependent epimerase/dehydratase family protein [Mycolicibacter longobardus]ORW11177.1 dehydrogenase [Mycolicibacter longobardus]